MRPLSLSAQERIIAMKRFDNRIHGAMYRSRKGIFLGVCRGIGEYFDFSVYWIRTIVILVAVFSGFWPVFLLYVIAALLMKPAPILPINDEDQREFYESYIHYPRGIADRIKRRYAGLEKRIQRIEHLVTSKEFDWEKRLNTPERQGRS